MRVSACKAARRCCIWHRSKTAEARRKLVRLPGYHQPLSHPARSCGLSAMKMLLYATGMAPARVFRSRGGDFALTGRQGHLRACMKDVQCFSCLIFSPVLNCQLLNRGGPFGVPIQWLTTAHKIPFVRGDGSRSGPSPCKARRG